MEITEAVVGLRMKLGDSQQAFATRLGLSIRGVGNYERGRKPTGKALVALARAADAAGETKLAGLFHQALADELGTWNTSEFESIGIEPRSDTERLWFAALAAVLRNPQYAETRRKLVPLLRESAQKCIEINDAHRLSNRMTRQIVRLLSLGADPVAIARDFKVPEVSVRKIAEHQKWVRIANDLLGQADGAETDSIESDTSEKDSSEREKSK